MFKIKRSEDGQFYWVLIGKNGEPLGNGETHTRKEKAIEGAEAVIDLILSNEDIEVGDFTGDLRRKKNLKRTSNGIEKRQEEPEAEVKPNEQLFPKQ